MCSINESVTLTESENTSIAWCKCCKTFSLIHNSCCASFFKPELEQFKQALDELRSEDFRFQIMDRYYAVIKNPHTCVGFCLTKIESDSLSDMIGEAQAIYEAFDIIYN